jgi:hypothetical protein
VRIVDVVWGPTETSGLYRVEVSTGSLSFFVYVDRLKDVRPAAEKKHEQLLKEDSERRELFAAIGKEI